MGIRITKGTFSADHVTPQGSHKFPEGLVLDIGHNAGELDEPTARRWVRAGFAEEFDGNAGDVITNEDVGMTTAQIQAEMQRLQVLRRQAEAREEQKLAESGQPGRISRANAPGVAKPKVDEAIGTTPYKDPGNPHPLDVFGLTEKQRTNLERAGFTRPDLIEKATDAELMEVDAIGEAAVAKLRGKGG